MAIIATEPANSWWRLALPLGLVVCLSCVSGSVPPAAPPTPATPAQPVPVPTPAGPEIRVGVVVSAPSVAVGGESALIVGEPDGSRLATIPEGETWQVTPTGPRLTVHGSAGWISQPLDAISLWGVARGMPVRVNGRTIRRVAARACPLRRERLRDGSPVYEFLRCNPYWMGVNRGETATGIAEVMSDRRNGLDDGAFDRGHHCSPGAVARIDNAWTRASIRSPSAA